MRTKTVVELAGTVIEALRGLTNALSEAPGEYQFTQDETAVWLEGTPKTGSARLVFGQPGLRGEVSLTFGVEIERPRVLELPEGYVFFEWKN